MLFINILGAPKAVIANVPEVNETFRIVWGNEMGIPVKPGDLDVFKRAVRKLMDDPAGIERMGRNGRRFLEDNMNLDKNSRRYGEIFKTLNLDR